MKRAGRAALLFGLLIMGGLSTGCGGGWFSFHALQAQRHVAEARELGAEELAPYPYYTATEHLRKAEEEAAEADYGDAAHLAATSNKAALEAIRQTRLARAARPAAPPQGVPGAKPQ